MVMFEASRVISKQSRPAEALPFELFPSMAMSGFVNCSAVEPGLPDTPGTRPQPTVPGFGFGIACAASQVAWLIPLIVVPKGLAVSVGSADAPAIPISSPLESYTPAAE